MTRAHVLAVLRSTVPPMPLAMLLLSLRATVPAKESHQPPTFPGSRRLPPQETQMSKPDLDTLKREALRLTAAAAMPSLQSPEVKSRLRKQQQSAEQFAAQSLVKAGIDLNALRKTWGESGHSVRATPNSLQEPQLKTLASHKAAFQANIERRREALASYGPI